MTTSQKPPSVRPKTLTTAISLVEDIHNTTLASSTKQTTDASRPAITNTTTPADQILMDMANATSEPIKPTVLKPQKTPPPVIITAVNTSESNDAKAGQAPSSSGYGAPPPPPPPPPPTANIPSAQPATPINSASTSASTGGISPPQLTPAGYGPAPAPLPIDSKPAADNRPTVSAGGYGGGNSVMGVQPATGPIASVARPSSYSSSQSGSNSVDQSPQTGYSISSQHSTAQVGPNGEQPIVPVLVTYQGKTKEQWMQERQQVFYLFLN
jgi:hypothetical protein